jgi:hypothetical protein
MQFNPVACMRKIRKKIDWLTFSFLREINCAIVAFPNYIHVHLIDIGESKDNTPM